MNLLLLSFLVEEASTSPPFLVSFLLHFSRSLYFSFEKTVLSSLPLTVFHRVRDPHILPWLRFEHVDILLFRPPIISLCSSPRGEKCTRLIRRSSNVTYCTCHPISSFENFYLGTGLKIMRRFASILNIGILFSASLRRDEFKDFNIYF